MDGEWNGKMIAKWLHTGRNEVFVDVTRIKIHEKLCKKVAEQGRFESRRLWRDVTYGLKVGHIEDATAAKFALGTFSKKLTQCCQKKFRENAKIFADFRKTTIFVLKKP